MGQRASDRVALYEWVRSTCQCQRVQRDHLVLISRIALPAAGVITEQLELELLGRIVVLRATRWRLIKRTPGTTAPGPHGDMDTRGRRVILVRASVNGQAVGTGALALRPSPEVAYALVSLALTARRSGRC